MFYQVDAFTDRPFAGNPAAVCIQPEAAPAAWMQDVAQEMNLAETAFLVRRGQTPVFDLRWFTPVDEVDLCGHATLASAHIVWETGLVSPGESIHFETRSGRLSAWRDGAWIVLDFPAERAVPVSEEEALTITQALGVTPRYVGKNRMDYLARLDHEAAVRALVPDMTRIAALKARGLIVTAASDTPGYDFISRFFAPQLGVPEDPVTGSAHCCLAPFWQERLGKERMTGYQASRRGGTVRVRVAGSRVHLGGQAVTVMRFWILGF